MKKERENLYVLRHKEDVLHLTEYQAANIICEWDDWKRYYLPDFSLRNKIVLDVGAGCGETTYFYLSQGAAQVRAIEMKNDQVSLLRKNGSFALAGHGVMFSPCQLSGHDKYFFMLMSGSF